MFSSNVQPHFGQTKFRFIELFKAFDYAIER